MRTLIELHSDRTIVLPVGYNALIRELLRSRLSGTANGGGDDDTAFAFSLSLSKGAFDRTLREFTYRDRLRFFASSPDARLAERLAASLEREPRVRLGANELRVASATMIPRATIESGMLRVRALTPCTAYGPITLHGGITQTCFFTPFEEEFAQLTNENLARLWRAINKTECPYELGIRPLFHGTGTRRSVHYGVGEDRVTLTAWWGMYELTGEPAFLDFALDGGIGMDTSKGFGFVEATPS